MGPGTDSQTPSSRQQMPTAYAGLPSVQGGPSRTVQRRRTPPIARSSNWTNPAVGLHRVSLPHERPSFSLLVVLIFHGRSRRDFDSTSWSTFLVETPAT